MQYNIDTKETSSWVRAIITTNISKISLTQTVVGYIILFLPITILLVFFRPTIIASANTNIEAIETALLTLC